MISSIKGEFQKKQIKGRDCILDLMTYGGVGYRLVVPQRFFDSIEIEYGQEIFMYASMQVREDSQTLYGFSTIDERDMFEMLITVSGIGPKTGLSVLSLYSVNDILGLLASEDAKTLSKASGLGIKGAQKIIIELKGKMDSFGNDFVLAVGQKTSSDSLDNVELALTGLGFRGNELLELLKKATDTTKVHPEYKVEDLIKEVLQK